jgi:hypothetical protein
LLGRLAKAALAVEAVGDDTAGLAVDRIGQDDACTDDEALARIVAERGGDDAQTLLR